MPRVKNPIVPGFHPDPSICRVDGDYYLAVSSFEYFPGLPIYHSRDLVHWRLLSHACSRVSQLDLAGAWPSGGLYAPCLRYFRGRFWLTCTQVSGRGNFIINAATPEGPWSEPAWVDQPGIDPDLFEDKDGKVYFTTSDWDDSLGNTRLKQSVVDPETGRRLTPIEELWRGTGALGTEGSHLYRIGDQVYLMAAEGGTEFGHMEVIARGPGPRGPWEPCPRNPILSHRSTAHPIQCTGHADLVQTPEGHWFGVFLGVRTLQYPRVHVLGRETFLAPVRWSEDGWPVFGEEGKVAPEWESQELPPPHPWPAVPPRDDFNGLALDPEWVSLRHPSSLRCDLAERPGWMTLRGAAASLDSWESPSWLGRRLDRHRARFETLLDYAPQREGEEAGICVWMNWRHHYEIGLTRKLGRRRIFTRRRIGTLQAETGGGEVPGEGPVRLRLDLDEEWVRLAWNPGNSEEGWVLLDQGEIRYLSTEVGGRFTGVFLALFATGGGSEALTPARFDWAELSDLPKQA